MKNQKGISSLTGIVIVVAVAVVAIGGIFTYQYFTTPTIGSPVQNQQVTEGWKTYTNNEYGFEFDYPKEWKISEKEIQNGLSIKLFPNPDSNKGSLTISRESKPYTFCSNCLTLDDVVSTNIKILEGSVKNVIPHDGTIDENRAVEILYRTDKDYQGSSIFFINNEKLYTISYLETNDIANTYEKKYREIIKSFHF